MGQDSTLHKLTKMSLEYFIKQGEFTILKVVQMLAFQDKNRSFKMCQITYNARNATTKEI